MTELKHLIVYITYTNSEHHLKNGWSHETDNGTYVLDSECQSIVLLNRRMVLFVESTTTTIGPLLHLRHIKVNGIHDFFLEGPTLTDKPKKSGKP